MMGIGKDSGFWIPPEPKQDRVGIPAIIPIPDQTPPPEFDPDKKKEKPDMDDHPRREDEPKHRKGPMTDEEVPKHGSVIIGDDGEEDDGIYNPLKDEDDM